MEPYLVILLGLSFVVSALKLSKTPLSPMSLQIGVMGHGRLMEPPARNAMWRFGFPNPINYNDNEVYCGGFGGEKLVKKFCRSIHHLRPQCNSTKMAASVACAEMPGTRRSRGSMRLEESMETASSASVTSWDR